MNKPNHLIFKNLGMNQFLRVWERLKSQLPVEEKDRSIEHALALHEEYYPLYDELFETPQVNPFMMEHLAFHVLMASQIRLKEPPEAETFYRVRLRKRESIHEVIHSMILLYQAALATAGEDSGKVMSLYVEALKKNMERRSARIEKKRGPKPIPRSERLKGFLQS